MESREQLQLETALVLALAVGVGILLLGGSYLFNYLLSFIQYIFG